MDITITPNKLSGVLNAIPSKSQAHRLLICAAFADKTTELICSETNQDIDATVDCLRALGADIQRKADRFYITPVHCVPKSAVLPCGESGSTLRFFLPIVAALGVDALFQMGGRLPQRPLSPLWELLEENGCQLTRPSQTTLRCTGKLQPSEFYIRGDVSSQYITGMEFAMAFMPQPRSLLVIGKLESAPYIDMTYEAMYRFGYPLSRSDSDPLHPFCSPGTIQVEGDWSNAAFFYAANALGSQIYILGLNEKSSQGDRKVIDLLNALEENICIDASDIPDLVPILAVVAGAKKGATFQNVGRLRLKESDRVGTTCEMLAALGCQTLVSETTLTVFPSQFHGGTIKSHNDHRIAMSAAIASTVTNGKIKILDAGCTNKSYPTFWNEFQRLGGSYELYLR